MEVLAGPAATGDPAEPVGTASSAGPADAAGVAGSVGSAEPVLSAYALLAQSRSLTVDLLQICGMSRESALAALAPTSKTPRYQPETFDLD